jgi:hypothetical protein
MIPPSFLDPVSLFKLLAQAAWKAQPREGEPKQQPFSSYKIFLVLGGNNRRRYKESQEKGGRVKPSIHSYLPHPFPY